MSLGMKAFRGRLGSTRRSAPTTCAHGPAQVLVLALIALAACEPSAPPGFTATAAPPSSGPAASASGQTGPSPVAGKPSVTVNGTTVQIVGIGNGRSPEFELPAGPGTMTVSVCASNQVIPFVTLYDGDDNKLGIIVEPTYALRALVGGLYYVDVASNPDCVWTIEIVPGQ
jgi:hypothetical protein